MNTKQTRRWNVDDKSTPDWRVVQCSAYLIIRFICYRYAQRFTSRKTKKAILSFRTTLSWIQIDPLLGDCSRVIWRWHLIIEIKSRVFGLLNMEMVLCERCLVRDKFLHAIGNQRAVGHVLQCSVTSLSFHYIEFNGFLKCSHCSETKPTPKTENVWMERAKTNTEMKRSFSLPQLPFVTISVWYNCVLVNDTTNEVRPRMARHNGTIQGLPWSMIIFVWQVAIHVDDIQDPHSEMCMLVMERDLNGCDPLQLHLLHKHVLLKKSIKSSLLFLATPRIVFAVFGQHKALSQKALKTGKMSRPQVWIVKGRFWIEWSWDSIVLVNQSWWNWSKTTPLYAEIQQASLNGGRGVIEKRGFENEPIESALFSKRLEVMFTFWKRNF